MLEEGNKEAALLFDALAYQIAKGIGELATVLHGNIDRIVLTRWYCALSTINKAGEGTS